MRHNNIFRMLVMSLTLILLIMVLPVPAAFSKETIDLSSNKGTIGDKITITGSGYSSGDRVYIYFSSEEADVDDDDIDDLKVWEEVRTTHATLALENGGDITTSFLIPAELTDGDEVEAVSAGDYFIYTTEREEGKILAKEEFTILGVTETKPTAGPVGTEVRIKGVGFDKEERIDVIFNITEIDVASGDEKTDDDGEFRLAIVVPKIGAGDYNIIIQIGEDEVKTKFTVEPAATISATSGLIGDKVWITGSGFAADAEVGVTFGADEVASSNVHSDGSLSIPFNVPAVGAGTYVVEVEDEAGNSAKFEFTLSTGVSISPATSQSSPGHIGMEATIYGSGFKPDSVITLSRTDITKVFSTTSDKDGSFSYSLKISEGKAGENIIGVTDGVNNLEVVFFLEAVAPPVPQLLLPAMNTRVERPVMFDWENVTDPSGVSYMLQVARDRDFKDKILIKQGLTESLYTMSQTEDEMLATEKAADYWWRVKAVDGAGNESGWTSSRSFNIGFASAVGGWWLYLVIGVGVLALLVVVFLVGRRIGRAK